MQHSLERLYVCELCTVRLALRGMADSHSTDDDIRHEPTVASVAPVMARRIFQHTRLPASEKQLVVIPGADHLILRKNPAALVAVESFLHSVIRGH